MPYTARHAKLDTPTARKKLSPRHAPYWDLVSETCSLGYRRGSANKSGTWLAKYSPQDGNKRIQKKIGAADDLLPADGVVCLSYQQAKAKAIEWFPIAAQISTGALPRRGGYTVKNACDDYLKKLEGYSRSVRSTRYSVNANVLPVLGGIQVEKLTRIQIEQWHRDFVQKRTRKPAHGLDRNSEEAVRRRKDTANRNLVIVKAALNHCLAEGKVACTNFAWKWVKPFKGVSNARTRFLSDDEARTLVNHCPPDFGLMVRGGLYSGMRYSELARIQVRDFDPISGTVLVAQSKAARPRRIYLDDEAISFFQSVCVGRSGEAPIFIQKSGRRWEKDAAKGLMAAAVRSANISSTTFHELRHSAASRWARLGLSLAEIATQLGHADVRMTQRYAHLCQKTLADKVRAMPALGIFNADPELVGAATIQ